jgi:hypothetical protein
MTVLNQIDRGIKASFPVRRMDFNFEHVDKYFYDGKLTFLMVNSSLLIVSDIIVRKLLIHSSTKILVRLSVKRPCMAKNTV